EDRPPVPIGEGAQGSVELGCGLGVHGVPRFIAILVVGVCGDLTLAQILVCTHEREWTRRRRRRITPIGQGVAR
ncbi:hypothetical protein, partial [Brevibacterium casei]|uniref:hypothetical protein n=1 Tax=Brevibacterium casei TaxID=33889 RepID=UPI001C92C034